MRAERLEIPKAMTATSASSIRYSSFFLDGRGISIDFTNLAALLGVDEFGLGGRKSVRRFVQSGNVEAVFTPHGSQGRNVAKGGIERLVLIGIDFWFAPADDL